MYMVVQLYQLDEVGITPHFISQIAPVRPIFIFVCPKYFFDLYFINTVTRNNMYTVIEINTILA